MFDTDCFFADLGVLGDAPLREGDLGVSLASCCRRATALLLAPPRVGGEGMGEIESAVTEAE